MPESQQVGSEEKPLRVAIIGSGPSGFYAAEALFQSQDLCVEVDLFDRMPAPFGLVRYGVAPDHQKIKAVTKVYDRIATQPGFRFYGNVHAGEDISIDELTQHYDHVVYAVGCESDKKLGIKGEDLEGSHTATEFVAWYNAHPDFRDSQFDLSSKRVAVVGVGNVAMDVTRVLIRDRDELAQTDIADHALEALRRSGVEEVILLGRRGPAQAAFSPKEIRELSELNGSQVLVRDQDMEMDEASRQYLEQGPADAQKNVAALEKIHQESWNQDAKKARLLFYTSPVEILGESGKVKAIKVERNKIVDQDGYLAAVGTGEYETLDVGLVFRSVGYYGVPIEGLPFDSRKGIIPNREGRIFDPETDQVLQGQYVVGWIKRGPTGLIGTNKADSAATVKKMVEDAQSAITSSSRSREELEALLRAKGVAFVSYQDWQRLDVWEKQEGENQGKVRTKIPSIDGMMAKIHDLREES